MYFCKQYQESYSDHNLPKVRPLFTLSHRGSDNSLVLMCSSEFCMNFVICILRHDFDQSDSVF